MVDEFTLEPIGYVQSPCTETLDLPLYGTAAKIRILPRFLPALMGLESYSHIWVLCWFHRANRESLQSAPKRVNPEAEVRGAFALRSPHRPNPISLTLTRLRGIDGDLVEVDPLDSVDGTPVVDIKPYTPLDSAFSATIPPSRFTDRSAYSRTLYLEALNHHGEACADLVVGVKLALEIDSLVGNMRDPRVKLACETRGCIVDVLQALTGARFGNPCRLKVGEDMGVVILEFEGRVWRLELVNDPQVATLAAEALWDIPNEKLFRVCPDAAGRSHPPTQPHRAAESFPPAQSDRPAESRT